MRIDYARVSTTEQNLGLQPDDLKLAYDASVNQTEARYGRMSGRLRRALRGVRPGGRDLIGWLARLLGGHPGGVSGRRILKSATKLTNWSGSFLDNFAPDNGPSREDPVLVAQDDRARRDVHVRIDRHRDSAALLEVALPRIAAISGRSIRCLAHAARPTSDSPHLRIGCRPGGPSV
jgi:hypothetical protein